MSADTANDTPHDYLIRAREADALLRAIHVIEADPTVALVRQLGPVDEPHTLVVSMTERQVRQFATHFAGQLIIERDRLLGLS